jgi:hypothetical protein
MVLSGKNAYQTWIMIGFGISGATTGLFGRIPVSVASVVPPTAARVWGILLLAGCLVNLMAVYLPSLFKRSRDHIERSLLFEKWSSIEIGIVNLLYPLSIYLYSQWRGLFTIITLVTFSVAGFARAYQSQQALEEVRVVRKIVRADPPKTPPDQENSEDKSEEKTETIESGDQ